MNARTALSVLVLTPVWSQSVSKVPAGVIFIKGAGPSASDSVTPVPEAAAIADGVFRDPYFGVALPLPANWVEKFKGPPPSDSGRYVLAQIVPASPDTARGSLLISAQDLFFGPPPDPYLGGEYKVESPRSGITVADWPFTFFAYRSPAAELHWYVLASEIRCHTVQFVLTGRDPKALEHLMVGIKRTMKLTANPADPVCIPDYARENAIARVNPVFSEHRFHPVPARIVIDVEGKVKHIHLLCAFPDQARSITDALGAWRFNPYSRDGQPAEVETGILFQP